MTMRVSTLFEKYIEHFTATKRPKARTVETYRWALGRAQEQLGDPLAAKTTEPDLQKAERLGLAVALTYGTAMRPSEMSALRWRAVTLGATPPDLQGLFVASLRGADSNTALTRR